MSLRPLLAVLSIAVIIVAITRATAFGLALATLEFYLSSQPRLVTLIAVSFLLVLWTATRLFRGIDQPSGSGAATIWLLWMAINMCCIWARERIDPVSFDTISVTSTQQHLLDTITFVYVALGGLVLLLLARSMSATHNELRHVGTRQ
jgi:hypothetical protein